MRILMLGWEFPPFITGGLGTACFGLTKALHRRGVEVAFVLPRAVSREHASHVELLSPAVEEGQPARHVKVMRTERGEVREILIEEGQQVTRRAPTDEDLEHIELITLPTIVQAPYGEPTSESTTREWRSPFGKRLMEGDLTPEEQRTFRTVRQEHRAEHHAEHHQAQNAEVEQPIRPLEPPPATATDGQSKSTDYGRDILADVDRYARFALDAIRRRDIDFDVIHAHDWMTYPAGMIIARLTGKPLVTHIHSTEFDRSGEHVNPTIADIERRGMHSALRVVAVSQLTRSIVHRRYDIPAHKIEVIYNGIDMEPEAAGLTPIETQDKIVLFFGRITYQKGPEYFIRAAKRVLEVMPEVKFVVAGSGDMVPQMVELAAELGIGDRLLFTGFLRGDDIKRVFAMADLYVMPSVSEPFGIAPLEAMSHDVPALISKSSGVSEVLEHCLKVDFWDVDDMANKIVAVLRHPPLGRTLREHGRMELRRLTWDGAAQKCEAVYREVIHDMQPTSPSPA